MKNRADESPAKKGMGKREREREKKKERKITENFTLIAPTVIVLLLSKYISSQTENRIHYQVYFVQHFFNAAKPKFAQLSRESQSFNNRITHCLRNDYKRD